MAEPTAVNSQITDAITQVNTKVLAEAPAMAMGSLYQTIGNSVAMAAANAVYAQQQANVTYQAATTLGIQKLFEQRSNEAKNSFTSLDLQHLDQHIESLEQQLEHVKRLKEDTNKEEQS